MTRSLELGQLRPYHHHFSWPAEDLHIAKFTTNPTVECFCQSNYSFCPNFAIVPSINCIYGSYDLLTNAFNYLQCMPRFRLIPDRKRYRNPLSRPHQCWIYNQDFENITLVAVDPIAILPNCRLCLLEEDVAISLMTLSEQ